MIIIARDGEEILIDTKDYVKVSHKNWRVAHNGYVLASYGRANNKFLSRVLMSVEDKSHQVVQVDHINGDKLDNRRANLRLVSHQQNNWNTAKRKLVNSTSKFKGVSLQAKKWSALITFNGKVHYIGRFDTEESAARLYDAVARMFFGEYAHLNFPGPVTYGNKAELEAFKKFSKGRK